MAAKRRGRTPQRKARPPKRRAKALRPRRAARVASRRSAAKAGRKGARQASSRPVNRAAARPRPKALKTSKNKRPRHASRRPARRPVTKAAPVRTKAAPAARPVAPPVPPKAAPPAPVAVTPPAPTRQRKPRPVARPALDRARRVLSDEERGREAEGADDRLLASVKSGGDEIKHMLEQHTESSPALTAGDLDARWDDAYSVGDEAPGGDNPTPDQDRVDDIGKALGVNYDPGEELQGSDKIIERDRHRWELDPASSDDWPHDKD